MIHENLDDEVKQKLRKNNQKGKRNSSTQKGKQR